MKGMGGGGDIQAWGVEFTMLGFWHGVFRNNNMVIRGVLKYIRLCLGEVLTPLSAVFLSFIRDIKEGLGPLITCL